MNLLCITLHDDIAARIGTAHLLVSLFHESTPQIHRAEFLRGAAANNLQSTSPLTMTDADSSSR